MLWESSKFVEEFVRGQAVAYIGAGVSTSANLISWGELLADLQKEGESRLENDDPVAQEWCQEKASTIAPTAIRRPPRIFLAVIVSPRMGAASRMTKTTLSLSIGATFDA